MDEVQKRLKKAYKRIECSNHPHWFIELALVRDEMCDIKDEKLIETNRHILQGQVDKILENREPIKSLEEVFHYNNLPCPRLLLILGAPG